VIQCSETFECLFAAVSVLFAYRCWFAKRTRLTQLSRFYVRINSCLADQNIPKRLQTFRARGSIVLEALCYNQEGRRFQSLWGALIVSIYLILPTALGAGFHQPLTEMSTRIMFLGSRARPVSKADKHGDSFTFTLL
jgi:hypothetical protein